MLFYKERDDVKRQEFLKQLTNLSKSELIYIDESGIDYFMYKIHGWSKRGQPVYGKISGKRYARENFIAGICEKEIIAPFCFKGTCTTEVVTFWIKNFLLPKLKPKQCVIMDNASFHKAAEIKGLIESADCSLVFLPPYSPDLNPIEKFWAPI